MALRSAGDEVRLIASLFQAFEEAGEDSEPVLDLVCRLGCELTGDPWIVRLVDDEHLLYLAGSAAPDAETATDISETVGALHTRYSTSRVAAVWGEGVPVLLTPEVLESNRESAEPALLALADRRSLVGGLLAPLRVRGRVIGVLWWACQHHGGDHSEDDLHFAATVADRCALAIDNARLVGSLRAERNGHAALLAQVSDAVCVVEADGTVRHVIPGGVTRVLGWGVDDLVGTNIFDLVHRKDHEHALDAFMEALSRDGVKPMIVRVRHKDRTWRHLRVSAQNLLEDPAVHGVVVTGQDMTERVQAEALLNGENDILERVATGAPLNDTLDAICQMVDGHVRHGVSTIWLVDDESGVLLPTAGPNAGPLPVIDDEYSHQGVEYARTLPPDQISVSDVQTGTEWEPWRASALESGIRSSWTRPIRDAQESVYGAVIFYRGDVREPIEFERKAIELGVRLAAVAVHRSRDAERLAHAATHDTVTDLPNRRLFLERLQQAVARQRRGARPPAVLFVDLDRFKQVNDRSGHAAGDEVLRTLGHRLLSVVRPTDVVARFGGDEFAILCDETGEDEAAVVAERLLAAICTPIEVGPRTHRLSASVGIAVGHEEIDADALIRCADLAMYRAKAAGPGRIEWFQADLLTESGEHDLAQALRAAIERRELTVDYQPIADLQRGTWVGVEALARWQHPTLGSVTPTMFVGLAEEAGLIGSLGEHVLDLVLADGAAWADDPILGPMHLSVNVSGRQLADPQFVPMLADHLARSGVEPRLVFLELTETMMMDDFEAARASLRSLQDIGIHLAIDDFGTGHSTLARLQQFPALVLKLDASFLDDLADDRRCEDIVAAVVQLAHAVGMVVCAEGVESRAHLVVLHRLGVDLAQGFLLARPVPIAELRAVLARPPIKIPKDGVLTVVRSR